MMRKIKYFFDYLDYFTPRERSIFKRFIAIQFLNGIFELIAISIAGLSVTIVTLRISGQRIPTYVDKVISWFGVDDYYSIGFILTLVLIAAALLVVKTIISTFINLRQNIFLGQVTSRISSDKVRLFPFVNYEWLKRTEQSLVAYSLGTGLTNDLKSILLGISIFLSEFTFLITVFAYLIVIDFRIAFTLSVFLGCFAYLIVLLSHNKLKKFGDSEVALVARNNTEMLAFLRGYKELRVSNSISKYASRLSAGKNVEAELRSRIQWLEQVPKYFLEVLIILVGLALFAFAALSSDADWSSTTLLIFSLVIVRSTPSLLRLQTGASLIRFNVTRFQATEEILKEFTAAAEVSHRDLLASQKITGNVCFENVYFGYTENQFLLSNYSLLIDGPGVTCFSGKSGVGKTTVLELICGLLEPSSGRVTVAGIYPSLVNTFSHSSIYYLPQEVFTYDGSLRENLLLAVNDDLPSDFHIEDTLKAVGLADFISRNNIMLDSVIGQDFSLSGGERQKLGFARAILSNASILVLDEPTAALDSDSEHQIFSLIKRLGLDHTVILVSHSENIREYFEDIRSIS
jgi:ABC-type multidrug transport system fused ATPase/permease subunit